MSKPADTSAKPQDSDPKDRPSAPRQVPPTGKVEEVGGRAGPEPTRYGDWEKDGRCVDF